MSGMIEDDVEFEVADNVPGAWVSIGKFSVHIKQDEHGITVNVYAKGYEDCLPLDDDLPYPNELADEMAAEEGGS